MQNTSPPTLNNMMLLRRTIVAALLLGIGLIYFLIGRAPGWQPFVLVSALAALSLIFTALSLRGNGWVTLFIFTILLLAIFWKPGEPWAALVGTILVLLNAFKMAREQRIQEDEEISEGTPPKDDGEHQEYVGI